jgi:hypothetical protein
MSPDDERIVAALRRLAGHLDVETGEPPAVERSRPLVGRIAALALVVVAAVGTVTVIAKRDRNETRPAEPGPASKSTLLEVNPTVFVTLPAESTTSRPSTPANEPLTRPVIDMPGCSTVWARGPASADATYRPYVHRTSDAAVVQVFAGASGSINDPYVVVERFFANQSENATGPEDINGQPGRVTVNGTGGGSVNWLLSDGSEVYVRDHFFDEAQLLEIARALVPRPADAAIPGFDLAQPSPYGLGLLDETFDPLVLEQSASSGCVAEAGAELVASVRRGRPVTTFTMYLDQPAPYPAVKMLSDGAVLVVRTRLTELDANVAIQSVRQATVGEWGPLLLNAQREEVMAAQALPGDPTVLADVVTEHFTSFEDLHSAAFGAVRLTASTTNPADLVQVVDGDLGVAVFVTASHRDDSALADVWIFNVVGIEPDLMIDAVTRGIRCRDGSLHEPGYACP